MSRSVVYTGISAFLPLFFAGALGMTKARGAAALSILLGTGVVGTLAGGGLAAPLLAIALMLTLPDSQAIAGTEAAPA